MRTGCSLLNFIMFLNFSIPTLVTMDLWRSGLLLGSHCPPVPRGQQVVQVCAGCMPDALLIHGLSGATDKHPCGLLAGKY